ncbi:MAG: hypothetical protein JEZ08_20840 [Clostridiales bacterium]|nr:hypothetical protein [Clostridiales bacterium]
MSKIYIIGIVASGKTTLSRKMAKMTDTTAYELDNIVRPLKNGQQVKRTPEEQLDELHRINHTGSWIIEGTYRKTCHSVLDNADQIVFLDPPLLLRCVRIVTRFIKQQLKLETCRYKSDLKMLRWMFEWTVEFEKDRDHFNRLLKPYEEKLIVLKRKKEIKNYMNQGDLYETEITG